MELNKIYNEDCLVGMSRIPDKSVDMILCDLPYGTTNNEWDIMIPFASLWKHYERIIKDNGAIVLTATQPFTSLLITSNIKLFRYSLSWDKKTASGFLNAKKMPLRAHEDIVVFYKSLPLYNPQFTQRTEEELKRFCKEEARDNSSTPSYNKYAYGTRPTRSTRINKYPTSVIRINGLSRESDKGIHPTQKPVPLFSYLIRTYTNAGDLVLDNCMGSGTTAISCIQEGRNFIGFEMNKKFYEDSLERIAKELAKPEQLKLIV